MPRPKKDPQEKRSEVARFRLTLAEKAHLREQVHASGLTEAEFLRRRALGIPVRVTATRSDPALVSELNRVGVNVNQLARATHRGADFTAYWREIGQCLQVIMDKVLNSYDP